MKNKKRCVALSERGEDALNKLYTNCILEGKKVTYSSLVESGLLLLLDKTQMADQIAEKENNVIE